MPVFSFPGIDVSFQAGRQSSVAECAADVGVESGFKFKFSSSADSNVDPLRQFKKENVGSGEIIDCGFGIHEYVP